MARGKGSSSSSADNTSNANDPLSSLLSTALPPLPPVTDVISALTPLGEVEDLRRFAFDAYERPLKTFAGTLPGFGPVKPSDFVSYTGRFREPKKVLVCVRRRARREVLHALGYAGRRGSGGRPRRRNSETYIKC